MDKEPWNEPSIIYGDHTEIFKFVNFPFYLGADGTKLLSVTSGWEPLFVYYYLKYNYHPVGGYRRHFVFVKEMMFSKPPIDVQKEFIRFVEQVDKSKSIVQKCIDKYDQLVKSRFIEMFGNPIKNEKKLPCKPLKDCCSKITNGTTPKGGSQVYVNSGIIFFRSQNVWRNKFDMDDVAYIDQKTHKSMKESSLKHNDILITKTGRFNTENSSLGRSALYLGDDDAANINGHVYLVRIDRDVLPEFVLQILISDSYKDYIRKVCVGGIDKRQINKDHVENFPILVPEIEKQRMFVDFCRQVDKSKFTTQILYLFNQIYNQFIQIIKFIHICCTQQ